MTRKRAIASLALSARLCEPANEGLEELMRDVRASKTALITIAIDRLLQDAGIEVAVPSHVPDALRARLEDGPLS